MTLNLEAETTLRNLSNEKLILIPPSTLQVTKQKPPQNEDKEQLFNSILIRTKSSSTTSLYPHGSRPGRKSKKQSDTTVCRSISSGERVLQVQAQLLTPKSASKIYGANTGRSQVDFNRFSKSESKLNLQRKILDGNISNTNYHAHTASYSSADSTITDSALDDSTTIDTSSLFSETTSYCTEDGIERTLSFSLPEEREFNVPDDYVYPSFTQNVNHDTKYSLCYKDASLNNGNNTDNTFSKNITISPTLSLPISTIRSNQNLSNFSRNIDQVYESRLSKTDSFSDASFLSEDDKLTELTSFQSCSSLSLDQDGLMLNEYSPVNGRNGHGNVNDSQLERELLELKQSLKLSEADTAILVSAKQQLQLDVHDLKDKKRTLEVKLKATQDKLNQSEVNALVAKRSLDRLKENSQDEIHLLDEEKSTIRKALKDTTDQLYSLKLENDQLKSSNNNTRLKLEAELLSKEMLTNELREFTIKNSKLDLLLQESCDKNVDNKDYINFIRTERTDHETKNYKKDQKILNQNLKIMQLQDMFSTLEKTSTKTNQANRQLTESVQFYKGQVETLKNDVSVKTKEKMELDGAVTRLHGDLYHVETAFNKIKKEIKQKSNAEELGLILRSNLERNILDLEKELRVCKQESENQKQRISDKNNQIAQVMAQLKLNADSKKKDGRRIEILESQIENYEKSKMQIKISTVEADLSRNLKEKSNELLKNENKIQSLHKHLELEKSEKTQIQAKLAELVSADDLKQKLIDKLGETMNELNEKLRLQDFKFREQEKVAEDFRLAADNAKASEASWKEKVDDLQRKIIKDQGVTTRESETTSLQHLDILSELQSSRRQLIDELDEMKSKNKDLNEEIKILNGNLDRAKKDNESLLKRSNDLEMNLENYCFEVSDLKSKYKESEKLVQLLKENSSILSQTITTMQDEISKYKEDLELKSKEINSHNKLNKILEEKLNTAKQELNSNSLQHVKELQKYEHCSAELKQSYDFVYLERNKLKEAVDQQQRYIVSLQQHYQQWAVNASALLHHQSNQQSERNDLDVVKKEIGTQTSHDDIPIMTSQKSLQNHESSDIGVQTDHDAKPMMSSNCHNSESHNHIHTQTCNDTTEIGIQANVCNDSRSIFSKTEKTFGTNEAETQTSCDLSSMSTQTVVTGHSSTATQTDVRCNTDAAIQVENNLFTQVTTQPDDILPYLGNSVKYATSSQTEDEFFVQSLPRSQKSKLHTQTQTDANGFCPNVAMVDIKKIDKFSQTILLNKVHDRECQTYHNTSPIPTSSNLLYSTSDSENTVKVFTEIGTQTLHDEIPIVTSQRKAVCVDLCDSGTQTDHNQQPVTFFNQIELKDSNSQTNVVLLEESGVQTNNEEASTVMFSSTFAQTRVISLKEVEIQTHLKERSTFSQTDVIEVSTKEMQTEKEEIICDICAKRNQILKSDVALQTLNSDNEISNSSTNVLRESSSQTDDPVDLPPLPNPLDVAKLLQEEDSGKLVAYKKTVKLLKSKLKKAENEANANKKSADLLQQEIIAVKRSLDAESGKQKVLNGGDLADMNKENVALKNLIAELKQTQQQEIDKIGKRNGIHRIQAERRIRDATERMKALVDANERLRKMVEKLQVKLTYSNKQQETIRREKMRYQHRARKLQSDLRSLSWLSTSNSQSKNNQIEDNIDSNSRDGTMQNNNLQLNDKVNNKLPSAVGEIDDILQTLRCEISALERQLSDHTSLVDQSNASWKQISLQSDPKNHNTELADTYVV